jgi:hypothetical protein
MSAGVQWSGLEDFRQILQNLPDRLTGEAVHIVDYWADATANQLLLNYPIGDTGNLRKGVRVNKLHEQGQGVYDEVKSSAPHAHLYEFGTQNRETEKGWKRGRVKPFSETGKETLIGIAIRNRRRMDDALVAMLTRDGFKVTRALG